MVTGDSINCLFFASNKETGEKASVNIWFTFKLKERDRTRLVLWLRSIKGEGFPPYEQIKESDNANIRLYRALKRVGHIFYKGDA